MRKESHDVQYMKWILPGILGAILMCTGDWLLGYVDPTVTVDGIGVLKAGYTQGYFLWRPVAAMITGCIGAALYLPALWGMRLTIRPHKERGIFWAAMCLSLFGWLLIHYFFCSIVYQYVWLCQNADLTIANASAAAQYRAFSMSVSVWYVVMAVPFLLHLLLTLRGKTYLSRKTALAHPVVWFIIIVLIGQLLPASSFSYGLRVGTMSEAMLVWFISILLIGMRKRRA